MSEWKAPLSPGSDPAAMTRPVRASAHSAPYPPVPAARRQKAGCFQTGCLGMLLAMLGVVVLGLAYLLFPARTNFLVLGIDRVPEGSAVGRSDTMILVSVIPLKPNVAMLSIPRDLWVNVPGVGENRINTAHFFAEANLAGSGPAAALETVQQNFGVDVPYYVRFQFDGFLRVVDALGGITVDLPQDMGGYSAGEHTLNSEQALAFARDRAGTDDFFRMAHAQILIQSVIRQVLSPSSWNRLPDVMNVLGQAVDTNLPFWMWPRLGLAFARAVSAGLDSRVIGRDMVTPFITSGGANVLLPNWEQINPVLKEMFGQ